jgi:hypothetical protein
MINVEQINDALIKSHRLRGTRKLKEVFFIGNVYNVVQDLERKRKCWEN